ncbi:MAG: NAD-dependent protein deacylase [Armatimonadetes bacterium]|nr:NAD-dependent protein deacylase [Armatimonadota bacterium]
MTEAEVVPLLSGRVLAFTGAGLSVPSGLPAFWGKGGLYEAEDAYRLASPEGFAQDPAFVWNWYLARIRDGIASKPNAGHYALAELEGNCRRLTIITANVDTLQEQAGCRRVFRLHGNIMQTLCTSCCAVAEADLDSMPGNCDGNSLPRCGCGGVLRPNVVWFGEYPDQEAVLSAQEELSAADVVLEVGHSGTVSYGFTETAVSLGKPVVRINTEPPPPMPGVLIIAESADIALPRLVAGVKQ